MGTAADDVAVGSLKYVMAAGFSKADGLCGENCAEEIVQTAALALLLIYII